MTHSRTSGSIDSRYVPVDFHFGGQHTSLTRDETGGFGLWTRRMDLHVSTQPASQLPYPPLPAFPLVSSPVSGSPLSSPSLGSQDNISGFSLSTEQLSSSSKAECQSPCSTASLPPPLLKAPGSGWFLPSSYVRCQRVSQRAVEPCKQSFSWVFPMAAALRFNPGSSAGVSRQQAPDPTLSGLCGGGSWGEITAVASHSLAQLRRIPVGMWGGRGDPCLLFPFITFLLFVWIPLLHPSHTFCLSLDLSLFHLPMTPSHPPQ